MTSACSKLVRCRLSLHGCSNYHLNSRSPLLLIFLLCSGGLFDGFGDIDQLDHVDREVLVAEMSAHEESIVKVQQTG